MRRYDRREVGGKEVLGQCVAIAIILYGIVPEIRASVNHGTYRQLTTAGFEAAPIEEARARR